MQRVELLQCLSLANEANWKVFRAHLLWLQSRDQAPRIHFHQRRKALNLLTFISFSVLYFTTLWILYPMYILYISDPLRIGIFGTFLISIFPHYMYTGLVFFCSLLFQEEMLFSLILCLSYLTA